MIRKGLVTPHSDSYSTKGHSQSLENHPVLRPLNLFVSVPTSVYPYGICLPPLDSKLVAGKKGPVFHVTGLSASQPDNELHTILKTFISDNLSDKEKPLLNVIVFIVPSCYDYAQEKVAPVEFRGGIPHFLSELL
ncbi:unnamed protein product [Fusarium langsethiae]|nr:unnamed protein product [Fusarium langsethiae]